jgi:Kef-type K+ transport system membrane component KefB
MLVGISLAPTMVGRSAAVWGALFSDRGAYILERVSLVALILFLFSMGVKMDLGLLHRPSGRAVAVGITGAVVPLAVTLPMFHALQSQLPDDLKGMSLLTELAVRLSLSSFPVIADELSDLDLLNMDLGRIALTTSLITDVTSWFLRAFTAQILVSFLAFVGFLTSVQTLKF